MPAKNKTRILVVDDEKEICDLVYEGLIGEGHACDTALNGNEAITKLATNSFDVALLDITLPDLSGMELLKIMSKYYQSTAPVMITAIKDIDTAVESMKLGASDYLVKPFTIGKLIDRINAVLTNIKPGLEARNEVSKGWASPRNESPDRAILNKIDAIAFGIEARIDEFDCHSRTVTQRTVEWARWLGLPEQDIERWASGRDELYSHRDLRIRSLLNKMERNPIAQVILGLTYSVDPSQQSGYGEN